ncbi:right-handed parallel beta-helix repeat-containing protein [Soonwooa sp.]|uniref:right-handed parallel beta-helix repeat-containing protein n=1 Tax=Soonwooa sp. TaxID=1938592 RepID=UPI002633361A|nr:right-handed parallel beta-helix repeat-containing protein [Soonwooa sp.]
MKKTFTLIAAVAYFGLNAQFTSPNTGVTYNLTSLAQAAAGTVTNNGDHFLISQNVTISANDKLIIDENTTVKLSKDVMLYVFGQYQTNATQLTYTTNVTGEAYKGIRFEDTSSVNIKNTTIENGGGLRVNTSNFVMDNCIVRYNQTVTGGAASSAAVQFGAATGIVIKNSQFLENVGSALGSGANISVSGTIDNNYFYGNNTSNQNRPQINMGPGGSAGIIITNNQIIGNRNLPMTGGISASALIGGANNVKIENNTIRDNRYGITVAGNSSYGTLAKNIIENNNTQNDPMNGGSGINFIGSGSALMDVKVSENQVRGNLWGVTLQGTAQANFGSDLAGKENIGKNVFKDNINGGVTYALYNNTPNNLEAKFNCWREGEQSTDAMVEEVITHQVDDPKYGLVNFKPYDCGLTQAVNDVNKAKLQVYPNPSNGNFNIKSETTGNVVVTDLSGKIVYSGILAKGENKISIKATSGVYLVNTNNEGKQASTKIIVK